MVRYHVRADGSMGVCTAQEGHCPFSGEEGTKHFTNKAEAERYSEKMIANRTGGGDRSLKRTVPREDINDTVARYTNDRKFIDSLNNQDILMITLMGARDEKERKGFDFYDKHNDVDRRVRDASEQEMTGLLTAAVTKDPRAVGVMGSRFKGDNLDRLIGRLDTISKHSDEDTGRKAREAQGHLAWIRDGQPYYPDWAKNHKDEVMYAGEYTFEPSPFGSGDNSEESLKKKTEILDQHLDEMNRQINALKSTKSLQFEDYDAFHDLIDPYDKTYDSLYKSISGEDVDVIKNPDYWNHEENQTKRELGLKMQRADAMIKEAESLYEDKIEDLTQDWRDEDEIRREEEKNEDNVETWSYDERGTDRLILSILLGDEARRDGVRGTDFYDPRDPTTSD